MIDDEVEYPRLPVGWPDDPTALTHSQLDDYGVARRSGLRSLDLDARQVEYYRKYLAPAEREHEYDSLPPTAPPEFGEPESRAPGRRKLWIIGALGLTLAAALAVVLIVVLRPGKIQVDGTFTLIDAGDFVPGATCSGSGGYSDIHSRAQVVVTSDSGETLALTHLGSGEAATANECVFSFQMEVPEGHDYYSIEVSHRGQLKYNAHEIRWVALSLGDYS